MSAICDVRELQIEEAERIANLRGDDLFAAVDQLVRQRDALRRNIQRAEKENARLHERLDVPYRQGEIPDWAIQAHDERTRAWCHRRSRPECNGLWQCEFANEATVHMVALWLDDGVVPEFKQERLRAVLHARPCWPDGTPVAWPVQESGT